MSRILDIYHRAPKGEALLKAMNEDYKPTEVEPKSAIIDPINTLIYSGVRPNPNGIPYPTLRRMARIPAIASIINTRLNQVARFARRPRYDGDLGFRIALKDGERVMSESERIEAFEIEDFMLKTGWQRNRVRKDNFNQFLRKITRDSLELDVMTFEKTPNRKNELAELWAIDGATIELVVNQSVGDIDIDMPVYVPETKRGMAYAGQIAYIQKINSMVVAEYTEDELAFAIRNPRTDVLVSDFGLSELEILIEIVTGILNGVRYNTSYFSHSHLPQGVLELVGRVQDHHLEGFKRHWQTLTEGASGKWSVPVMALEEGQGFKFTPFKNSNKDMEFNEFLDFLFNIACAVYQIDPNEVGFKSWTGSSSNAMFNSDSTQARIDSSRDKGFIPLMNFLADTFNSEIIDLIDDKYVFEWVGLDEEDEDRKLEREKILLEMGRRTVNELRVENDEEEIEEEWANAPANPTLLQVYMAEKGHDQAGMAGMPGMEGTEDLPPEVMAQLEAEEQAMKEQQKDGPKSESQEEHQAKHDKAKANVQKESKINKQEDGEVKKSIEDDFKDLGIAVSWEDY